MRAQAVHGSPHLLRAALEWWIASVIEWSNRP